MYTHFCNTNPLQHSEPKMFASREQLAGEKAYLLASKLPMQSKQDGFQTFNFFRGERTCLDAFFGYIEVIPKINGPHVFDMGCQSEQISTSNY